MSKTIEELEAELLASNTAIVSLVEHSQRIAEALRTSMDDALASVRKSRDMYTEHVTFMQALDDQLALHSGETDAAANEDHLTDPA